MSRPNQTMTDTVAIPDAILDNHVVGYGLSLWVVRVDAVAKCYMSRETSSRDREIAVYRRLAAGYTDPHECIVQFYGVLDGSVLLHFQQNGSIRQYRPGNHPPVDLPLFLRWAEQVIRGLSLLYDKGIIHGGLSCNNVFLDADLNARIGDFAGSSIDGQPFITVYETSHSLPDDTSVSIKRDLFALGAVLHELITGHTPFHGQEASEIEKLFSKGSFRC